MIAFVIILAAGLALATVQKGHPDSGGASLHSLSAMVHLSGARIQIGIDANEIARFQKLFSIKVAQLFAGAVPKHKVTVRSFFIDRYLVTNSQFKKFVDENPDWRTVKSELDNGNYLHHWVNGSVPPGKENDPVVNINWYAATSYCRAQGKRLPSEAEWEYAARGGLKSPLFPWGDKDASSQLANYSAAQVHTTTPVGTYPPNGYGLYDMAGNVWEFLADEWSKYPADDGKTFAKDHGPGQPSFLEVRTRRVIRGGSFDGDPINLWVEYRDSHPPNGSQPFVGFRCGK